MRTKTETEYTAPVLNPLTLQEFIDHVAFVVDTDQVWISLVSEEIPVINVSLEDRMPSLHFHFDVPDPEYLSEELAQMFADVVFDAAENLSFVDPPPYLFDIEVNIDISPLLQLLRDPTFMSSRCVYADGVYADGEAQAALEGDGDEDFGLEDIDDEDIEDYIDDFCSAEDFEDDFEDDYEEDK
jgi:hypothetical protein